MMDFKSAIDDSLRIWNLPKKENNFSTRIMYCKFYYPSFIVSVIDKNFNPQFPGL